MRDRSFPIIGWFVLILSTGTQILALNEEMGDQSINQINAWFAILSFCFCSVHMIDDSRQGEELQVFDIKVCIGATLSVNNWCLLRELLLPQVALRWHGKLVCFLQFARSTP